MLNNFESYLQDEFMKRREVGGMPITKDNCEDMFDAWLSNLDGQEYMDYADSYNRSTIEKVIEEVAKITRVHESPHFLSNCRLCQIKALKAKWLGKDYNLIAGVDFGPSITALNELSGRPKNA
jgi:hypothetical protein